MVPGSSVKSSKEALRLSRLYPAVIYSTAGNYFKSLINLITCKINFKMSHILINKPIAIFALN